MYVVSRFLPVHLPVTAGGGPGVDWRDRDRVGRLIADDIDLYSTATTTAFGSGSRTRCSGRRTDRWSNLWGSPRGPVRSSLSFGLHYLPSPSTYQITQHSPLSHPLKLPLTFRLYISSGPALRVFGQEETRREPT